jgi:hypothetical protein
MDGTYTFCPQFFKQLYTIHGFQNGQYVPLVLYYYLGSLKLSTDTVCLVLFNCVLTLVLT